MQNARPFDILPAIDLRGGRVVRLVQGDFDQETAYATDPVATAVGFADGGRGVAARRRPRRGADRRPGHRAVVAAIAAAVGERIRVEVAGGLRDARAVADVLESGAARAVVGTAALADPAFAGGWSRPTGRRGSPSPSTSATGGPSATAGRLRTHGVDAADAIRRLADAGRPDLRGHRDRPRRAARRPGPRALRRLVAPRPRHDHRLGRHHDRGRPGGGPRHRLWRRDHRPGPVRRAGCRSVTRSESAQWPPLWPPGRLQLAAGAPR